MPCLMPFSRACDMASSNSALVCCVSIKHKVCTHSFNVGMQVYAIIYNSSGLTVWTEFDAAFARPLISLSYSFCKSPDAYKSSSDNLCSAASNHFFKKIMAFTLEIWEKVVPLHSQNRNKGSLAQLNRAFDYGSKGYRFESYWDHKAPEIFLRGFLRNYIIAVR